MFQPSLSWARKVMSRYFKNVSIVVVGLVLTGLDLIESWGWKMGVDICGLTNNLVKPLGLNNLQMLYLQG